MDQRVSLITLAVTDLDRSQRFYEALGWSAEPTPDGIVVFDLIGQSLGLYDRGSLAQDIGVDPDSLGSGAITLACNVRQVEDVAAVVEVARDAGATVLKESHEVFWGGTIAYLADPDGHVWEVAHNPAAPLAADGRFRWAGYDVTADDA